MEKRRINPVRNLTMVVESTERNYSAYLKEADGVTAIGSDLDKLVRCMHAAIDLQLGFAEEGEDIPDVLKGPYRLVLEMPEEDIRGRKLAVEAAKSKNGRRTDGVVPQKITEQDKLEEIWYKESRTQTLGTLPDFINHLMNDYIHDYGTVVKAFAAAASATLWACNNTEQGGLTGYQASLVKWGLLEVWEDIDTTTGCTFLNYNDMLFPQYQGRFAKVISAKVFKCLQQKAQDLLESQESEFIVDSVKEHLQSIVNGTVPFGYEIRKDD